MWHMVFGIKLHNADSSLDKNDGWIDMSREVIL